MRDARYLRAQAELCLEMAWQISDPTDSEICAQKRPVIKLKLPRLKLASRPR